MSWRLVGLAAFAVISAVVGLTSTVIVTSMVDEVNRALPREEQVDPYGWYPGKVLRVVEAYRRTHPAGGRLAQLGALVLVEGAAFVLGAVCILFPA
jgi:hypothetical protein